MFLVYFLQRRWGGERGIVLGQQDLRDEGGRDVQLAPHLGQVEPSGRDPSRGQDSEGAPPQPETDLGRLSHLPGAQGMQAKVRKEKKRKKIGLFRSNEFCAFRLKKLHTLLGEQPYTGGGGGTEEGGDNCRQRGFTEDQLKDTIQSSWKEIRENLRVSFNHIWFSRKTVLKLNSYRAWKLASSATVGTCWSPTTR